jgi:hypothetical protein
MQSENDDLRSLTPEQEAERAKRVPRLLTSDEQIWSYEPTPHEVTAFHEASHAVAAVKLGIAFTHISMSFYQYLARPGDDIGGLHLAKDIDVTLRESDPANAEHRDYIARLAVVVIAGEAGQAMLEERECNMRLPSAAGDYQILKRLASWMHSDAAEQEAFRTQQTQTACELVCDRICDQQIYSVACRLRTPFELGYDQVVATMKWRETADDESTFDSSVDD